MPVCGNCGKDVAASDVTCPHCGVLLAAYSSPIGSGAPEFEVPSADPQPAEIPTVDLDVPDPVETEVITDPAQIAEEAASTAPRPLFDTRLTIEEISRAAEGDHEDDLVTVTTNKVPIKKVEFEVPDYAKPPKNADPIPVVEDADANVPVITHDSVGPNEPANDDDDDVDPSPAGGETWLLSSSLASQPRNIKKDPPKVATKPKPKKPKQQKSEATKNPPGQTDAYLRKLHEQTGYQPTAESVSAPVEQTRPSRVERARRREQSAHSVSAEQQQAATASAMNLGCTTLYMIMLTLIWGVVIITMLVGEFNPGLIFVAALLTWGWKPMRNAISKVSNQ